MPANDLRSDKIWMDGTMVPYDEATVHVLTHSLHYGLAVFEVEAGCNEVAGLSRKPHADGASRTEFAFSTNFV